MHCVGYTLRSVRKTIVCVCVSMCVVLGRQQLDLQFSWDPVAATSLAIAINLFNAASIRGKGRVFGQGERHEKNKMAQTICSRFYGNFPRVPCKARCDSVISGTTYVTRLDAR